MFGRKNIYLDTASTTPVDKRVMSVMKPYFSDRFGNPASLHALGRQADDGLKKARLDVASFLSAHPDEVFFTGGGTEALNWAIFGVVGCFTEPKHIVVSAIEHEAVIEPCLFLERQGWKITFVSPDKNGIITPDAVRVVLSSETVLVIVMAANNELGTIQPIKDIAKEIRHFRKENKNSNYPYLLVDACQAPRALELSASKSNVDLLVVNGSKIYGPKGVGALYIRRGVEIKPFILGGGQESGKRSGTSNMPSIIGLSQALQICLSERDKEIIRLSKLRDWFEIELKKNISDLTVNGEGGLRLPYFSHISISGLIGEQLVIELSAKNIACSSGSACSSFGQTGSRTLRAIGLAPVIAESSLRFSFDRKTSKSDLKKTISALKSIVEKLRNFKPKTA